MARFANTIDNQPIYAARAEADKNGDRIDTTYLKVADLPAAPVQDVEVDGTSVVNAQGVAEITMPTVPTATSELTNDSGFITASDVAANQAQADWTESSTSSPSYIQHKPDLSIYAQSSSLASVATTGDYDDLTNKPSIPAAQVNSDWNASSGVAQILNKPNLATVATSGSYNDLLNKPSIPPTVTVDQHYDALSDNPQSGTAVAEAIAGTGQVPTVTSADDNKVLMASYTDGVGSFSWEPSAAATQVNSDWDATSGVAKILNKPTIPSGVQLVPAATSADADKVLTVDSLGVPGWAVVPAQSTGLFQATYGTSTYNEVRDAVAANKIVYCYVSGRMAFLAYVGTNNYEFQYYRSNSSSSGTDSIFVYKVSSSGWTTTERTAKAGNISYPVTRVNVNGASAMTGTVANITIPAAPTVDQQYDAQSSNAQSGTAVAGALSTISQVPSTSQASAGDVLTVDQYGEATWSAPDTQEQSDWTESDPTKVSYIQNKPTIDQTYNALSTNAQSGTAVADALTYINQVPNTVSANTGDVLTVDSNGDAAWVAPSAQAQEQSDWTESDPTAVSYIQHKPTQKPLVAGQNVVLTEGANNITIDCTASGGGGSYTAGDGISIASDVIAANVDGTTIGIDPSTKKIKLLSSIPSVDLTYNAASTNAQSGIAVASALHTKQNPLTAGDGISIDENDEISAKLGDGLEIGTSLSPVTDHARAIGCSDPDIGVSAMQMLDPDVFVAIETTGLTFTVQNLTDNNNVSRAWTYWGNNSLKLYPAICAVANYGSSGPVTDPYRCLVLSTTGIDVASSSGTIPAGTQFTYNLDDINTSLSTITWETISDQPDKYSLSVVWRGSNSTLSVSALGTYTANEVYYYGALDYQAATFGAIAVSNPLPASTIGDAGKVLKVDSNGDPEWESEPVILGLTAGSNVTITEANNAVTIAATDTTYTAGNMIAIDANNSNAIGVSTTAGITDIQQVAALPANPVSTVLYLIPET